MKNEEYTRQYEEFINNLTKEKAKKERKKTYSFRKHLEDKGFIKSKNSAIDDSETVSSFNDFLNRKKEMGSNE